LARTAFSLDKEACFGSFDFDTRALAREASFLGFLVAGFLSATSLATTELALFTALRILGPLALSFRTLIGFAGFLIGLL
jgi:hypothetical protein